MVCLAIIGGKLQGTEACYLAKKAGYFSVLIDREENPPAKGMCDKFVQADVLRKDEALIALLKSVDFVLPAMENDDALSALHQLNGELNIAFDFNAYALTSSKRKSDLMFRENNIPSPVHYPGGTAPYIAKPVNGSGSSGVRLIDTAADVSAFFDSCNKPKNWIVQEYLSGKSYSIEVIGKPGSYKTYQITEIHTDENYDCRMVTCPCNELTVAQKAFLSDLAIKVAELLRLKGIMDIEAILSGGKLKILEIDARIPSQTPTAVYYSTGINFLEEIYAVFCGTWANEKSCEANAATELFTAFEHLEVSFSSKGNIIKRSGEGIMTQCTPLSLFKNYLGSDEVITDFCDNSHIMRCTMINAAKTDDLLSEKRKKAYLHIAKCNNQNAIDNL